METSRRRRFGALVLPLQAFLSTEAAGGVLLLGSTVVALLWANLWPETYARLFDLPIGLEGGAATVRLTLRQFINMGLMSVFFFVVGMEIKRELAVGELSSIGKATLPAIAAAGGMVLPAAIFAAMNREGVARNGWGIPMATDIAFCVGILTLLKRRVPHGLVVFVTALAIFDDIGGIVVIAAFYGHGLSWAWLAATALLSVIAFAVNRAYVRSFVAYGLLGAGFWYALHRSGIHASIAGVVLGLAIPATAPRTSNDRAGDAEPPIGRFLYALHPFVSFFVMPVFALANAGVFLGAVRELGQGDSVALGAAAGLFIGKQLGIFGTTLLAVRLGLVAMPGGATRWQLYGVSVLSGIGFTVALFMAALAYPGAPDLLERAKIGIFAGSALSGLLGYTVLRVAKPRVELA